MLQQEYIILFLSDGRNNLDLMAQGFVQAMNNEAMDSIGACMSPPELDPAAAAVMREVGIDITGYPLLTLTDIEPFMYDLVVTLGHVDPDCRPTLPGMPPHFHWAVPDPDPDGDATARLAQLREARDQLRERLHALLTFEFLHALSVTRRNLEVILDNLQDGVMAHTPNRRIFFFNRAAERITGYERKNVIGQDCHDVFPGRFCGGACKFCEGLRGQEEKGFTQKQMRFERPDGEERILRMTIMPLPDGTGKDIGALLSFTDETELFILKRRLKRHHALGRLIGRDPKTLELFDVIKEVASVSVPVLIEGESGTGKELVANAIHDSGPRADRPFVAINCGALPEGVLESELFGHESGAFTGALKTRKGRFELAHKGTIFLDEIGEVSPAMQVKLLRVLQEQRFERVGGEKSIHVDVRIISATNQNLKKLVEKKKFRRDLFYRLCVVPITVPPLRERRMDIPLLIEHYIDAIAREIDRPVLAPSDEALDLLGSYDWPGNVRELRNAIEYAYVKCRTGIVTPEHLPPEIVCQKRGGGRKPGLEPALQKAALLKALSETGGNRKEAARRLGIGRATLYRYLDAYQIR